MTGRGALAPMAGELESQAASLIAQGGQLTGLLQSIDAAVTGPSPPAS